MSIIVLDLLIGITIGLSLYLLVNINKHSEYAVIKLVVYVVSSFIAGHLILTRLGFI